MGLTSTLIITICSIVWISFMTLRTKFFLHMMQLEGYKNKDYKKWISRSTKAYSKKIIILFIVLTIISTIYIIYTNFKQQLYFLYFYVAFWIIFMLFSISTKKEESKKELVFTQRAKRLFAANIILNVLELLFVLLIYLMVAKNEFYYIPVMLYVGAAIYFFEPQNIILSNILVNPIEKKINMYYYTKAQTKIKSMDKLQSVGITGSFGKTSTKFIIATILNEKYKVLKTPQSYNTPMGISKVINNDLNDEYEIFVAEMGARNIGDIKELAELVKPKVGIITSIGPAHLETFKNVENIMKTKYELIQELPTDGVAIFNYDNKHIKKLADKTFKEKMLYGLNDIDNLDIYATDIQVGEKGSSFTLNDKDGNKVICKTKLLGEHNIYNILAGVCAAKVFGFTYEEIRRGIEKVQPVPHRLDMINPGTGVIIIDDAFNSNPVGAKAALDVISEFKQGRKIIVTPGMVELGDKEEESNKEFGINIGRVCDFAILVGKKRTKPIYEGLLQSGFNKKNIFIVNNLKDATNKIQTIVKPKDVVLFENDLPDNYNE